MTDPIILTSLHGGKAGLTKENGLVLVDPHTGHNQYAQEALPGHRLAAKVRVEDDFTAGTLSTQFNTYKGSDGAAAYPVIAVATGGTVALVTSGAGASSMAVSGSELTTPLIFKAANGSLVYEAKAKISAITTAVVYLGFTDNDALESAFAGSGSGNGITSNATDGCGFLLSTNMTAGTKIWAVGVANDVDAANFNTAITPVADTYNTYRVELGASGNASFYIDGTLVGTMATALTPTVALTAVASIYELTTSARTLTLDTFHASMNR